MSDIITGLDDLDKALTALTAQVAEGVLAGTVAAGEEIYQEVERRAKGTIKSNITLKTRRTKSGGAWGIIQVDQSGPDQPERHALFLEYGTSRMAAQPFMRPGFEAARQRAIDKFTESFSQKVKS